MAKQKSTTAMAQVTITAGIVAASDATIEEVREAIRAYKQRDKNLPNGWEACGVSYRTVDGNVHVRLGRNADDEAAPTAVAHVTALATEQQCRQIAAVIVALGD